MDKFSGAVKARAQTSLPLNGCFSVHISYSTHPSAHTSDLVSYLMRSEHGCTDVGVLFTTVLRVSPRVAHHLARGTTHSEQMRACMHDHSESHAREAGGLR
jgi:hypothetical protein